MSWDERILTPAMGLYTSLYAFGIWHDATQARWNIVSVDAERLVVKGRWPRIPVVQIWDITLLSEGRVYLDMRMRILKGFPLKIFEAALMLDSLYRQWSTGEDYYPFPPDVTRDDFFRISLSSRDADGKNKYYLCGKGVPSIAFMPAYLPCHRIVLENAGHISSFLE